MFPPLGELSAKLTKGVPEVSADPLRPFGPPPQRGRTEKQQGRQP
jgi:hypothetical protein